MASDGYKLNYNNVFGGGGSNKLVLGVIVLAVIIYGVWQGYSSQPQTTGKAGETTEALTPSADALQTYAEMCSPYSTSDAKVSCEDAVAAAFGIANGTVQGVSIAPARVHSPKSRVNLWLVDIKLATPYFDSVLQKEVVSLQVGIGVNESVGVYKKPLETR